MRQGSHGQFNHREEGHRDDVGKAPGKLSVKVRVMLGLGVGISDHPSSVFCISPRCVYVSLLGVYTRHHVLTAY